MTCIQILIRKYHDNLYSNTQDTSYTSNTLENFTACSLVGVDRSSLRCYPSLLLRNNCFFIGHTMTRVNLELFLHWMSDMEKWGGFFSQILGVSAEKSRTRMKITAFEPRENVMPPMPDFFFGPFFLVCFLAARKVFLSWAWGKTPYLFPSKNICDRCDSGSLGQPLSPFPPIFSTPGGRHPNLPGRSSLLKSDFFVPGLLPANQGHLGWFKGPGIDGSARVG